jgi:hypothetical protein
MAGHSATDGVSVRAWLAGSVQAPIRLERFVDLVAVQHLGRVRRNARGCTRWVHRRTHRSGCHRDRVLTGGQLHDLLLPGDAQKENDRQRNSVLDEGVLLVSLARHHIGCDEDRSRCPHDLGDDPQVRRDSREQHPSAEQTHGRDQQSSALARPLPLLGQDVLAPQSGSHDREPTQGQVVEMFQHSCLLGFWPVEEFLYPFQNTIR